MNKYKLLHSPPTFAGEPEVRCIFGAFLVHFLDKEKIYKIENQYLVGLFLAERGIDFVHLLRCRGHPCKKKKQTNLQINLSFCLLFFLRRERDSCFGKRLRRLRTPTRVFSSSLIQKRKPDSFLFLAEREGFGVNPKSSLYKAVEPFKSYCSRIYHRQR